MGATITEKEIDFIYKFDPQIKKELGKIQKLEEKIKKAKEELARKEEKKITKILNKNGYNIKDIKIYRTYIQFENTREDLLLATVKIKEKEYYLILENYTEIIDAESFLEKYYYPIEETLEYKDIENIKNLILTNQSYERILEIIY